MAQSQRPQPLQAPGHAQFQPAARMVDQGAGQRVAPNANVSGLINALQSINPAIERWAGVQHEADVHEARQDFKRDAQAWEDAGKAEAAAADLTSGPNVAPIKAPPPAFADIYRQSHRLGIATRVAGDVQADFISQYNDLKDQDGFNPDEFLAKGRAAALNGLDPDMAAVVGERFNTLEGALRKDVEDTRMRRLSESRGQAAYTYISNLVQPGSDPEAMMEGYYKALPALRSLDRSPKEAAALMFARVSEISDAQGGRPELFQALLDGKDQSGIRFVAANPELAAHIQNAKEQARRQVDKDLTDAAQEGNAFIMKGLEDRLMTDPGSIGFEELLGHMGKFGAFRNHDEVLGFYRRRNAAVAEASKNTLHMEYADMGLLGMESAENQAKIMGLRTDKITKGFAQAIVNKDPSGAATLGDALIFEHNRAGSSIPSAPLKGLFSHLGSAIPGDAPTPLFETAVALYRRLESAPHLREAYFDDKARKVMDAYIGAVGDNQTTDPLAYKQAYQAVSPEAEKRAEMLRSSPEFKERLKAAHKAVEGSSWWPTWLGGNGRPDNKEFVSASVQDAVMAEVRRNPSMTQANIETYAANWTKANFVLDETTQQAVRIPRNTTPEAAQRAITNYTAKLTEQHRLGDMGSEWGVMLIPVNPEQGTYRSAVTFNGVPQQILEEVSMRGLMDQYKVDKQWLPQDAATMRKLEMSLSKGEDLSPVLAGQERWLAKAKDLGQGKDIVNALEKREGENVRQLLAASLQMGGPVDSTKLFQPKTTMGDNKLAFEIASRAYQGDSGSTDAASNMALSLITLGESVVLSRSPDPAKGAGDNIAMGYNLKANSANAPSDLKRAGVPAERVQDVIDGKASLTPEQAMRLTQVTIGRYQKVAAEAVNATKAGLWAQLLPAQKAVLTDIAWQTGDVGQFKKALASLSAGDSKSFREQIKVFFTNQAGERVEDTRRGALRDAMLQGPSFWNAVLTRQGKQPASPIDRLQVATTK